MRQGTAAKQDGWTKPLRPGVTAIILAIALTVVGVVGLAWWNKVSGSERPVYRREATPFRNLKLSEVRVTRKLPLTAGQLARLLSAPLASAPPEKPKTPVPYLPYTPPRKPRPPEHNLSGAFMNAVQEIAVARLEQGGIEVPERYMPTAEDPNVLVPVPEEQLGPTNGSLWVYVEAFPDTKHKGTVVFEVSWRLSRQLYFDRDSPQTASVWVAQGGAGPFRVWEKHLESAIIYELEKMIAEQIISPYRSSNRIGAKGK